MITVHPYEKLGQHDYGWLKARYHFSFGDFYDPQRMGFGSIRVINDDIIKGGAGFPPHPHRDMEIITYVRSGAITHQDSLGNYGRTVAGDVQVMSAGSGIQHGEYNRENEATTLYQIWIEPREKNIAPRWDSAQFPKEPLNDHLKLIVSGKKDEEQNGALYINADAEIYAGKIASGAAFTQTLKGDAYLLVSTGEITVNGQTLKKGDGGSIKDEKTLALAATSDQDTEILLITLP